MNLFDMAQLETPGAEAALEAKLKPQPKAGFLQSVSGGMDPELAAALAPEYGIDPEVARKAAKDQNERLARNKYYDYLYDYSLKDRHGNKMSDLEFYLTDPEGFARYKRIGKGGDSDTGLFVEGPNGEQYPAERGADGNYYPIGQAPSSGGGAPIGGYTPPGRPGPIAQPTGPVPTGPQGVPATAPSAPTGAVPPAQSPTINYAPYTGKPEDQPAVDGDDAESLGRTIATIKHELTLPENKDPEVQAQLTTTLADLENEFTALTGGKPAATTNATPANTPTPDQSGGQPIDPYKVRGPGRKVGAGEQAQVNKRLLEVESELESLSKFESKAADMDRIVGNNKNFSGGQKFLYELANSQDQTLFGSAQRAIGNAFQSGDVQRMNAYNIESALQDLKAIGGNDSDRDVQNVLSQYPNVRQDPRAARIIWNRIKEIKSVVKKAKELEKRDLADLTWLGRRNRPGMMNYYDQAKKELEINDKDFNTQMSELNDSIKQDQKARKNKLEEVTGKPKKSPLEDAWGGD